MRYNARRHKMYFFYLQILLANEKCSAAKIRTYLKHYLTVNKA